MDICVRNFVVQLILNKLMYHLFILRGLKSYRLIDRIPFEVRMYDVVQSVIDAELIGIPEVQIWLNIALYSHRGVVGTVILYFQMCNLLILLCLKSLVLEPLILKVSSTLWLSAWSYGFCWTRRFLKRCIVIFKSILIAWTLLAALFISLLFTFPLFGHSTLIFNSLMTTFWMSNFNLTYFALALPCRF